MSGRFGRGKYLTNQRGFTAVRDRAANEASRVELWTYRAQLDFKIGGLEFDPEKLRLEFDPEKHRLD